MNLLFLKGFNNYFNRKIKKYSELDDYKNNSDSYYDFADINFNPNDGVATVQVVGSENQKQPTEGEPTPLDWENDGSPDYVIAYESRLEPDPENENLNIRINTIKSRWFVLESVRERAGQYKLALKRDIIADHLEQILTNPCFVEKGYVQPTDPLIFNNESVSFNQIKKSESYLKDETGIPWICCYIAKNYPEKVADVPQSKDIYAKIAIDKSQAIDVSALPWTFNSSGQKIKAAGQIIFRPISTLLYAAFTDPIAHPYHFNVYGLNPYRWTICFDLNGNTWRVNKNTSRNEFIGIQDNQFNKKILKSTSFDTTNNVFYNFDFPNDKRVPIITNDGSQNTPVNITTDNTCAASIVAVNSSSVGSWGLDSVSTTDWKNINENFKDTIFYKIDIAALSNSSLKGRLNKTKSLLTTKYGNQVFKSDSLIMSYNGKLVKNGNNYYRVKIKEKQYKSIGITQYIPANFPPTITLLSNNSDLGGYPYENEDQQKSFDEVFAIALKKAANEYKGIAFGPDTDLANKLISTISNAPFPGGGYIQTTTKQASDNYYVYWEYKIEYERVPSDEIKFTLAATNNRQPTNDSVFDIVAFPFGSIDFKLSNNPTTFTSEPEASLAIARQIAMDASIGCYDVQILPYCPYRALARDYATQGYLDFYTSGSVDDPAFPVSAYSGVYKKVNDQYSTACSIGIYSDKSSGTFNIYTKDEYVLDSDEDAPVIENYNIDEPDEDSVEYKIFNHCKKFKLVSPNYTSGYDFMPLKNNGIKFFNVDFSYKPYNPFIHVAPYYDSESLYGVDTNDVRGLILNGDFSIATTSSAWANYQVQNSNYSQIFNREMQNLDFNQSIERDQFYWQNVPKLVMSYAGVGDMAIAGASAGGSAGPWGALIGGIAGNLVGMPTTQIAYNKDEEWMRAQQKEARSYRQDMYELSLGTIKAIPNTLTKSDSLNGTFKYFPFIEEYDCTKKEKQIFRDKLKYDGMTVDAIGSLNEYINTNDEFTRLKGRIIMIDNIVDDFHISDAIYQEVNKGFYLVNQYEPEEEETEEE